LAETRTGRSAALRARLPLATRSVIARLRRRAPSPLIRPWTGQMTAIAVAAVSLSLVAILVVDPLAVGFVRANWSNPVLRALASITDLGKSEWYLVPAGLAVIALALADWTSRGTRTRARLSYVFGQAAYVFAAVALSGILVNVFKLFVGRARPVMHERLGPAAFDPFRLDYSFLSYPSGHATTAGAVALILMLLLPRLRLLVLVVAGLVAFSRVASFAHYPGDVVAGFALGFLFSLWLARWLAARGLVFRVNRDTLLPVPRHAPAWRSFFRNQ
jgi:membrane-associated phospholipid phosphatase